MIIGSRTETDRWTLRESRRVEGFLRMLGIADAAWQIRFDAAVARHSHVDALALADRSEFLLEGCVFLSAPYAATKPLVIPFLTQDFGIDRLALIDRGVPIEKAASKAKSMYPDVQFQLALGDRFTGDEGVYITWHGEDGFAIFYADRGETSLLASTPFAWAAVMFVALQLDYTNIDWAGFNPAVDDG